MSSKYGGRGGSTWRPSGKVSGTDWFNIPTGGDKQTRQTRNRKSNKQRKQPTVTRNSGSGWSRLGAGVGSAALISGIGFIGNQIDKSGMQAQRKSQRYLKDNPTYTGSSYLGKSTWNANTRLAREENKKRGGPKVPQSGVIGPPVKEMPKRPISSPVAESKFDQNVKAAIAKFPPRKTAAPNPAPKLPALKTQTVTTHSVDKVRSGAAGSGGPQTGKSKTRVAFEKQFAAARQKQGAGGTFKFKNPNTGKTTTHTTDYKKAKKKK